MPTTTTALTIRRSTEDRQQQIVLTVLALAAEQGVDAITTQAIADRIGLTQGAVFRHFPTKEAIWSAVLDWLVAKMEELFGAAEGLPPLAALKRVFEAYMALFARYPAVPRLFFSDTFHHPYPRLHARLQAMVRSCEERLATWIRQAQRAGDISPVSSPVAAKLLLTCIQGLAFQTCVLGIIEDPAAIGRKLFPLCLAALGVSRHKQS